MELPHKGQEVINYCFARFAYSSCYYYLYYNRNSNNSNSQNASELLNTLGSGWEGHLQAARSQHSRVCVSHFHADAVIVLAVSVEEATRDATGEATVEQDGNEGVA